MIQTLHKHGFSVIMDAVYNHVYKRETSPFEKRFPGIFSDIMNTVFQPTEQASEMTLHLSG